MGAGIIRWVCVVLAFPGGQAQTVVAYRVFGQAVSEMTYTVSSR